MQETTKTNNEITEQTTYLTNRCLTSITNYNIDAIETIDISEFQFRNGNKEFTIMLKTKNGESISLTADQFTKRTNEMQDKRYEEMTDTEKELLNTANRKDLILK